MNLIPALRELVSNNNARSETARLRDIFDEVEKVLQSGVKREAVLALLHDNGFSMTMASFKSALQRIRKERRIKATIGNPPHV